MRRPVGCLASALGRRFCGYDNFLCVWLFTIYIYGVVLCTCISCWSDIKVPCPLAMYMVLGSIVASVGVNPSHLH